MTLYDLPKPISRQRLREISTPNFKGKTRHKATQFGELADELITQIKAAELKVIKEEWRTAINDMVLFGSIDVKPDSMQGPDLDEIGSFTLSLRTSNNNKYALAFLCGARVDKLDNDDYFCFGDTAVRVRNNKHVNISEACESAVNMFIRTADKIQPAVDQLRATQLTEGEAAQIILYSSREMIPITKVKYVLDDFLKQNEKTAWILWQSFKKAYTRLGAEDRFEMSKGLYPLFCKVLGTQK